jgi:hypothetical protein
MCRFLDFMGKEVEIEERGMLLACFSVDLLCCCVVLLLMLPLLCHKRVVPLPSSAWEGVVPLPSSVWEVCTSSLVYVLSCDSILFAPGGWRDLDIFASVEG